MKTAFSVPPTELETLSLEFFNRLLGPPTSDRFLGIFPGFAVDSVVAHD